MLYLKQNILLDRDLLVRRLIGDAKKAFLVIKKWNKELWNCGNPKSLILTRLINLNKILRSRKSQRQRGNGGGGGKKGGAKGVKQETKAK